MWVAYAAEKQYSAAKRALDVIGRETTVAGQMCRAYLTTSYPSSSASSPYVMCSVAGGLLV
jgi:hypothetical protein